MAPKKTEIVQKYALLSNIKVNLTPNINHQRKQEDVPNKDINNSDVDGIVKII